MEKDWKWKKRKVKPLIENSLFLKYQIDFSKLSLSNELNFKPQTYFYYVSKIRETINYPIVQNNPFICSSCKNNTLQYHVPITIAAVGLYQQSLIATEQKIAIRRRLPSSFPLFRHANRGRKEQHVRKKGGK